MDGKDLPFSNDIDDVVMVVGTVRLDDDDDGIMDGAGGIRAVSVDLGLFDFDDGVDFCIEGVSNDSLAFGSSNWVYLPIDGLLITFEKNTHQ
jgi:hypothetical protein